MVIELRVGQFWSEITLKFLGFQIYLALSGRPILKLQAYDFRQNCTPLSSFIIINPFCYSEFECLQPSKTLGEKPVPFIACSWPKHVDGDSVMASIQRQNEMWSGILPLEFPAYLYIARSEQTITPTCMRCFQKALVSRNFMS